MEALIESLEGEFGVFARNLRTGKSYEWQPHRQFPTASTMKLPVLLFALSLVQKKSVSLDERIEIHSQDYVGGSGVLKELGIGLQPTLLDLLTLMMIVSDNLATNRVLQIVGVEATNRWLQSQGLEEFTLYRPISFAKDAGPLAEGSPYFFVELLAKLWSGDLLSHELTKLAEGILAKQQYKDIIGRYLTGDKVIATKSGWVPGVRGDVGYVFAKDRPLALAIFAERLPDTSFSIEHPSVQGMGKIAQMLDEML